MYFLVFILEAEDNDSLIPWAKVFGTQTTIIKLVSAIGVRPNSGTTENSSSALFESRFFGVESIYLDKNYCYNHVGAFDAFLSLTFWTEIMSQYFTVSEESKVTARFQSNRLRINLGLFVVIRCLRAIRIIKTWPARKCSACIKSITQLENLGQRKYIG